MEALRCTILRAGTSKAVFLRQAAKKIVRVYDWLTFVRHTAPRTNWKTVTCNAIPTAPNARAS